MQTFDLAVIGAGTGGLVSAFVADSLGASVALIEKERIGGECLWTGCVPSKTLIKTARVFDTAKRAAEFGVRVENPRLIWGAVKLRIADVRDEIKALEREELAKTNISTFAATARFADQQSDGTSTLHLSSDKDGDQTLCARKVILATGSKVRLPEIEGLQEVGYITHEQVYSLPALPRSLAIIGGGPIACEMAQAFARFDCRVTILQRGSTLLSKEDAEISAFVAKMLRQDGVTVQLNADVQSASTAGEKKRIQFTVDSEKHTVDVSEILVATGKEVDLSELNLEAAGAHWSTRGIEIDEHLKAASNLWACGDVTGKYLFTHVAEAQGKIAAQNALLPIKKKWDDTVLPWTTFTDPEIARVGLTETEAREQYGEIKTYRQEFSKLDRAIIEGETRGFLKVVTATSGRVLGAHIAGPSAGELIHQFVAALRDGALIQEFAESIHVYPTLSEIGHRAGNEYFQELVQSKWVQAALAKVV